MDRSAPKPQTVADAKQQLLAVSRPKYDYLAAVKQNPAFSMGAALAAGVLVRQVIKKGGLPPSLLSLGLMLLKKL